MAEPLLNGALGKTSMGPRPFLGPNHNSEKRASSIGSEGPFLEHLSTGYFCAKNESAFSGEADN